jgi:AraC-like DNA-binding protein
VGYGSHTHEFFEIVVFDRAGGFHGVLGQQSEEICKGQVWMLPPGTAHDLTDLGEATGWLVLLGPEQLGLADTGDIVQPWLAQPLVLPFLQVDSAGRTAPMQLTAGTLRRWIGWLGEMETELATRRLGYSQAVTATLNLLLISAARLSPQQPSTRADPLVTRAFAIVDERFSRSLALSDIADALHVTPGHLTEIVRRRTGRPLGEWILQRRMTQARLLLGETEALVADVAAQCGFTTVGHFGRQFRRLHGMSPSTWRLAVTRQSPPRAGESS